jgi:hypothetical protein
VEEPFPMFVLFSDEATFTREGIFNSRNSHVWAEENPRGTLSRGRQEHFGVNVWAGIVGEQLIGPYILPPHLNGHIYLTFLRDLSRTA